MKPFFDRAPQRLFLLLGFALVAYVGAFMYPEAHWHHGLLGGTIYLVLLIPVLAWLFYAPHGPMLIRLLSSVSFWAVIVVLFSVVSQRHYLANQLLPDPGSSAKGMELPARALLLHGHELYSVSAIGTPVSPGPGWILLWSPLTVPGWTGLLESVALLVTAWMLRRRIAAAGGLFILLMLSLPLFFRMASGGWDLLAIPMAFVVLALAMDRASDSMARTLLLALVGGAVATARVPMLLPVLILGFGLWRKNRRTGAAYLIVMVLTAMAWHLSFAAIAFHAGHWYQPVHVLARAGRAGTWNRVAAVVLGIVCLGWCYKRIGKDVRTWLLGAFLMMMVLFTPTGIAEGLHDLRWDWEGAGYICFPVPLLIAVLVLNIRVKHDDVSDSIPLAEKTA